MSQEVSYKTRIRVRRQKIPIPRSQIVRREMPLPESPSLELLAAAVEKTAKDRGGSVDETYFDCLGRGRTCWRSIHIPGFWRGLGVAVRDDGRVDFVYDTGAPGQEAAMQERIGQVGFRQDQPELAREASFELAKHFAVLAISTAMKGLGRRIEVRPRQDLAGAVEIISRDSSGRECALLVDRKGEARLDMLGYKGTDCVRVEEELRKRIAELGLELEVAGARKKDTDAPAGFRQGIGTRAG